MDAVEAYTEGFASEIWARRSEHITDILDIKWYVEEEGIEAGTDELVIASLLRRLEAR